MYLVLRHLASNEAKNKEMIIIETSIRKTLVEIVMDMKQSTIPSQMARIKFMINVEDDFLNLLG